jgi:hypothetical protein
MHPRHAGEKHLHICGPVEVSQTVGDDIKDATGQGTRPHPGRTSIIFRKNIPGLIAIDNAKASIQDKNDGRIVLQA